MYRTILVPLDGSRRAEAILPHVEALALAQKARVVFLYVVAPPPAFTGAPGTPAAWQEGMEAGLRAEATRYLSGRQGEFRELGLEAVLCVEEGPVVETILRVAERYEAGLIAMASHGRTGLGRVFYGSVAAGVLHGADRPLLLVRSGGEA